MYALSEIGFLTVRGVETREMDPFFEAPCITLIQSNSEVP